MIISQRVAERSTFAGGNTGALAALEVSVRLENGRLWKEKEAVNVIQEMFTVTEEQLLADNFFPIIVNNGTDFQRFWLLIASDTVTGDDLSGYTRRIPSR